MNEPKRRGRPPKSKPCADCGQVEGHYDDCPVGVGAPKREMLDIESDIDTFDRPPFVAQRVSPAQAYADRVWCGQSPDTPRAWRVERVRLALEGQGLPFEGVVLP